MSSSFMAAPGLSFFTIICNLDLAFIVVAGFTSFPRTLADEKQDDNLALLIMTGLSPLTILLSKSVSKLLEGLFLLATQIPLVLLAVTLGGVSAGRIATCFLTIVCFLFLAVNLGLFCAVVCRSANRAVTLTQVSIVPMMFIPDVVFPCSPFVRLYRELVGES